MVFDSGEYKLSLNGKFDNAFLDNFKDVFHDITGLSVFNWIEADNDFLYSLKHLKEVSFATVFTEVDLSRLPQLTNLSLPWWHKKNIHGLSSLKNLKHLSLVEYDEEDFEPISSVTGITSLSILRAKCRTLKDIEKLSALKAVSFRAFRRLADITGIETLSDLEYVEFDGCPKMADFNLLGKLTKVETLRLVDCKHLSSISFVKDIPRLLELVLLGSTVVNDNDLTPAQDIESVYGGTRKSYNINLAHKEVPVSTIKSGTRDSYFGRWGRV